MTSTREPKSPKGTILSPLDLQQIRDAVGELRAATPESVLADLVEEKIRELAGEARDPAFEHGRLQDRQVSKAGYL